MPSKKKNTRSKDRQEAPPAKWPGPKPELLAPAGGPTTWAAAVEAGADAVYLGLKEFSARAFAANFTLNDLARVIDLTHERGAKVFVAMNVVLKQGDLPQAARDLDTLARLAPDALILQDLGLLRLIKRYYPQFEVHASTLLAVHNLPGLQVLADLGFKRCVLARELTLTEVEALANQSSLGLEMFIHGALCFSFSGLCLMSSFLGGKGSLRGACTQPCRRFYTSERKKGYLFSPTDLDATTFMAKIRQMKLAALKIEGRMKGAEYVTRVVKAYRLLLDTPEEDFEAALIAADRIIEESPGRKRSPGFLQSARPSAALNPTQAATSGLYLGQVQSAGVDGGTIILKKPVRIGDRLRVLFRRDGDQQAFTLKKMIQASDQLEEAAAGQDVRIGAPFSLSAGDLIFKVDSAQGEQAALATPLYQALAANRAESPTKPSPILEKVLAELTTSGRTDRRWSGRPEIWYRLARVEQAIKLSPLKPGRFILPLTPSNVRLFFGPRRSSGLSADVVWALPPLIFDQTSISRELARLVKMGAREFMIANLGHLPLLKRLVASRRPLELYADYHLNCFNSQAEKVLADLGLAGVTISLETDEKNLRSLLEQPGPTARLFYLFGRPPLFTSRFDPAGIKDEALIESPKGERFRLMRTRESLLIMSEQPVFFASFLRAGPSRPIKAFLVDLEFDPRPVATAHEVSEAIRQGRPLRNTSRFNWERGLF